MNSPLIFQAWDNTSTKNNFEYTDFYFKFSVAVLADNISD